MTESSSNPIFVAFLFILRCLIPLGILFGISYLLRRFGLVVIDSPEPAEDPRDSEDEEDDAQSSQKESK